MELGTGMSSPAEGAARLRPVADVALTALTVALEDSVEVDGTQDELALPRDAATLATARRRLSGPLQLTVNPFDSAAYRGLGSYLGGPGVLALAAYERVSGSTARGI